MFDPSNIHLYIWHSNDFFSIFPTGNFTMCQSKVCYEMTKECGSSNSLPSTHIFLLCPLHFEIYKYACELIAKHCMTINVANIFASLLGVFLSSLHHHFMLVNSSFSPTIQEQFSSWTCSTIKEGDHSMPCTICVKYKNCHI